MSAIALSRWFASIPSVTVEVECSGATHSVSWRRGKVVLHDHRLRDEDVVLALGGAPPPCVAMLAAWRDRRAWAAASRPHPPGFVRRVAPPALPEDLAAVRQLGVIRSWERSWRHNPGSDDAEDLYRMLRRHALPRVATALDAARARFGGGPARFVEVRLARPNGVASVEGRITPLESSLVVVLPPSWIYDVGSRDAAEPSVFSLAPGTDVEWVSAGSDGWVAQAAGSEGPAAPSDVRDAPARSRPPHLRAI